MLERVISNLAEWVETHPYHHFGCTSLDVLLKSDSKKTTAAINTFHEVCMKANNKQCCLCSAGITSNPDAVVHLKSRFIPVHNMRQITGFKLMCKECSQINTVFLSAVNAGRHYKDTQQFKTVAGKFLGSSNESPKDLEGAFDKLWEEFVAQSQKPCVWDLKYLNSRNIVDASFINFTGLDDAEELTSGSGEASSEANVVAAETKQSSNSVNNSEEDALITDSGLSADGGPNYPQEDAFRCSSEVVGDININDTEYEVEEDHNGDAVDRIVGDDADAD